MNKENISKHYNPKDTEEKWYNYWTEQDYFSSKPDGRTPYTVILPPPNVTGVLHMGHMLNGTIQDVLVRKARMQGYNTCWVPGTDHASIATEAKVVNKLKEQGISKIDIGRDAFLKEAWDWTNHHGGIIIQQLKKLGASCDWKRERFTLDDDAYKSVIKCFVSLYEKGLIYRKQKMLNWDPIAKTTISDEEVIHVEKQSELAYINYPIIGENSHITIATVRPETILGDVAICINPNDNRYKNLIGKSARVPICDREIPIITDEYVDMEFGTGCLKITPAHDPNDYELGLKYNLPIINILNEDATLNSNGLEFEGLCREEARKKIIHLLKEKGLIEKVESYQNKVGTSERTSAIIEPRLSLQWFLNMEALAKPAIKAIKTKNIELIPAKFEKTYLYWMENVRDWNISRQLWWGHRIPAYFYGSDEDDFVVAETIEEALKKARKKSGDNNLKLENLKQEEDVLDTWFSSWLWPITVFNGINNPNNKEINYYYPSQILVTAPEILFFWVARMIMIGYEFNNSLPFEKVYLTGIVRDNQRRKMSKSLGNSPDPIKLMEEYSTDGVRMGMLFSSPAGNDLLFDEKLCLQGRNFTNKLWNAFRLINNWEVISETSECKASQKAILWFETRLDEAIHQINLYFERFQLSECLKYIYSLIWEDFCSYYLESIKPNYGEPIGKAYLERTIHFLEVLLKLLHPFAPFITEQIWQDLSKRSKEKALIISEWPREKNPINMDLLNEFLISKQIISQVRDIQKNSQIPSKESLSLTYKSEEFSLTFLPIIQKLCKLSNINPEKSKPQNAKNFSINKSEFYVLIPEAYVSSNSENEKYTLLKEKSHLEEFLNNINKKLTNNLFVEKAPKQVIEIEKKKKQDTIFKLKSIENKLNS